MVKEDGFFFFLMFFSKWSIKILLNEHKISRLVFEVSMKDSEFRFFLASNYLNFFCCWYYLSIKCLNFHLPCVFCNE